VKIKGKRALSHEILCKHPCANPQPSKISIRNDIAENRLLAFGYWYLAKTRPALGFWLLVFWPKAKKPKLKAAVGFWLLVIGQDKTGYW
jgi:hypothetical protein